MRTSNGATLQGDRVLTIPTSVMDVRLKKTWGVLRVGELVRPKPDIGLNRIGELVTCAHQRTFKRNATGVALQTNPRGDDDLRVTPAHFP